MEKNPDETKQMPENANNYSSDEILESSEFNQFSLIKQLSEIHDAVNELKFC